MKVKNGEYLNERNKCIFELLFGLHESNQKGFIADPNTYSWLFFKIFSMRIN